MSSSPRRNRQQRFVRTVVYILVLALVVGLVATMVGTALAVAAHAAFGDPGFGLAAAVGQAGEFE